MLPPSLAAKSAIPQKEVENGNGNRNHSLHSHDACSVGVETARPRRVIRDGDGTAPAALSELREGSIPRGVLPLLLSAQRVERSKKAAVQLGRQGDPKRSPISKVHKAVCGFWREKQFFGKTKTAARRRSGIIRVQLPVFPG